MNPKPSKDTAFAIVVGVAVVAAVANVTGVLVVAVGAADGFPRQPQFSAAASDWLCLCPNEPHAETGTCKNKDFVGFKLIYCSLRRREYEVGNDIS